MSTSDRSQPPLRAVRTTAKCPICGKPIEQTAEAQKYGPFCGKRCADIDLGRWLKEGYRVPAEEAPTEEDFRAPPPGEGPSNKK
jgi:endogenous inhibitor of DNA gyrase (YacG/DUF329 family)